MTGFFTKQETQSKDRPDGKSLTCYSCGLLYRCKTPKMKPYGNFKKGILNIGSNPQLIDDHEGKPFQDHSGKLLEAIYKKFGIDLFEDCLNINAVNCLSTNKDGDLKSVTNFEIDCCRKSVLKLIEKTKPKIIVLLGIDAVYSLLGHRWKGPLNSINEWYNFTIPDQDLKTWICPVFDPKYVEEKADKPEVKKVWELNFKKIKNLLYENFLDYVEPKINIIDDLSILTKVVKKNQTIAFDYETTGLKPHAKGHRIVCCSIAINEDEVFVFEMPKEVEKRQPFLDILLDKSIKKMAHNMKYENNWSLIRLKTRVRGWFWDSMIAAHLLDNRTGITGLKFQTYVNFGIINYNESVKSWLEADNKNANSMNKLQEYFKTPEGRKNTLTYCALDSIYEYRLALKQQKEIELLSLPF